jgi:glycosyltransferase involved in cell wall biosynthesis
MGVLDNEKIIESLPRYDLFYMPTLGENFGHSIVEAMQAGCLPLISDKTPWRQLQSVGAGWDLPLNDPAAFTSAVETVAALDQPALEAYRARLAEYLKDHDLLRRAESQNLKLFQ